MKRTAQLLVALVAGAATITGVAVAASSPTVSTGATAKVGDTTATLQGTVNPNGNKTAYVFQYGLTSAYGASTASRSIGHGTKTVQVAVTVGGLTPGTVYHYRVAALNRAGGAVGRDRSFTTSGHPPAAVVTGVAVGVGKTVATVTGSVNPEGATTTWVVQYGLSASYGMQTFPQNLPAVSSPLGVSLQLVGLAPATLFHYRIVAYHGTNVVSAGGDQTFFTEPELRPTPTLRAHTTPSRARTRPYVFTTNGTLSGAGFIPASARCTGNVGLRYYANGRQIGFVVVPVGLDCRFSAQDSFRRLRGPTPAGVRITVDFRGNGYLRPVGRTDHVTAG